MSYNSEGYKVEAPIDPPINSIKDLKSFYDLLALTFQSDIPYSVLESKKYYDKTVAMIFNYIFTGEWPARPPTSAYAFQTALNFYKICNDEVLEIIKPVITAWKLFVFGNQVSSLLPEEKVLIDYDY